VVIFCISSETREKQDKKHSSNLRMASTSVMKKESLFVTFDLESTGLDTNTEEIIQIAALPMGDSDLPSFNRFILPTVPIQPGAANVHGMKVMDGCLIRRGEDLEADEDAAVVLAQFFKWCAAMQEEKNVVLVAHYGAEFDFKLLFSMAQRLKVHLPTELQNLRLADSLPASRRFRREFKNCKLETLKHALVKDGGCQTHDALDDCGDLEKVLVALAKKSEQSVEDLLKTSGAVQPVHRYKVLWEE